MASGRRPGRGLLLGALGCAAWCLAAAAPRLFVSPPRTSTGAAAAWGAVGTAQGAPSSAPPGGAQHVYAACGAAACGAAALAAASLALGRRCDAAQGPAPSGKTAVRARGGARGGGSAPLVVIAGPPAAGKGTQCEKIKAKYGYVHISTGDILRENVKNGTELGKKAKEYMDSGALVPSELIVDLVKDRLDQADVKEKGCLLDGFPRAPDQAQAMTDAGLQVQRFLLIKVPDDTLVERGCGRRLDPETGDIYHLKFKPPPEDIVDRLVHRSDDQEEKIRARLDAYHSQIDGILPYFKEVVVEVDGTGRPDDVFDLVAAGLDSL